MARFTLVVRPDGNAILAARDRLDEKQTFELRDAIAGWKEGRWPVLVINDCDVVQVLAVELDLDPTVPVSA